MSYLLKLSVFICLLFSCQNDVEVSNAGKVNAGKTPTNSISQFQQINFEGETIADRFPVPEGFERKNLSSSSFGHYLRNFPLKQVDAKVHYFNGGLKSNQSVHAAVLDIDTGNRDLQQCADAVMRLRAEYLFKNDQPDDISFNFTNGFKADFKTWSNGNRIVVSENNVIWKRESSSNSTYRSFRKYMNMVFAYAGTASLTKELKSKSLEAIEIGDVLIQGGHPGHAVIVMDVAVNKDTDEKLFMLAQSYMPAQDMHVLKNPNNQNLSPWYAVTDCEYEIKTPEWMFNKELIKSF